MPYHVQIRRSFHVARAFNLEADELRRDILAPWLAGARIELGDKHWVPADSSLTVLEGPRLEPAEMALGQGWSNAERSARGVTRELLASAAGALGASGGGSAAARSRAVALLAESPAAERSACALLAALRLEGAAWAPLRAAILTRAPDGGPLPAAVLIALDAQPQDGGDDAGWWLDVGLALGAFGPRAVVALAPGRAAPTAVRDAGAVTLDPAHAAALGVRLRAAGISV